MSNIYETSNKMAKTGEAYKGKVVKIIPSGAFIDFGFEQDGFVHIGEISEERIPNVESVLSMDQEVSVRMLGMNHKGKPKLSIKRASSSYVPKEQPVEGKIYDGVVKSIHQFGAFVDFGCESDGFVHVREIAEEYVPSVEGVLSVNQKVKVKFLAAASKGFQLTMKGISQDDESAS